MSEDTILIGIDVRATAPIRVTTTGKAIKVWIGNSAMNDAVCYVFRQADGLGTLEAPFVGAASSFDALSEMTERINS